MLFPQYWRTYDEDDPIEMELCMVQLRIYDRPSLIRHPVYSPQAHRGTGNSDQSDVPV